MWTAIQIRPTIRAESTEPMYSQDMRRGLPRFVRIRAAVILCGVVRLRLSWSQDCIGGEAGAVSNRHRTRHLVSVEDTRNFIQGGTKSTYGDGPRTRRAADEDRTLCRRKSKAKAPTKYAEYSDTRLLACMRSEAAATGSSIERPCLCDRA